MTAERVVAVLGYSPRRGTALHPVCAGRLAHARGLTSATGTVILSGESELMRAAWTGPDVLLVCDPEARSTVDNARNVAATARELGARELVVVTSSWHRARARVLLRAALRGSGIRVSVEASNGPAPPLLLARELACLVLLPFQLAQLTRR
jgi:uncharacterized SAM-binding protein YcdF (DUF218 family)